MKVAIQRAAPGDIRDLAVMTGEYQAEMLAVAGMAHHDFQLRETEEKLREFLDHADYAVLLARTVRGHPLGYVTVFESLPYSKDTHGIIGQIYVRPFYRRRRIARRLLEETRKLATENHWRRLMVTFPLAFRLEAALALFEKQGFGTPGQLKQWLLV